MEKELLKQVLGDQRAELKLSSDDLVTRSESLLLIKQLDSSLVKVVQGIRRCGKSSLCAHVLSKRKIAYVNFDDERLLELSVKDFDLLLKTLKEIYPDFEILFFDEIQNVSGWELFVNRLQRNKYNVVLTGSNGKLLGKDLATHLTGRQITTYLFPFSFVEFLKLQKAPQTQSLKEAFNNYFELGGFPEVILGESRGLYLRELFDKIVSRDIIQRFHLRESKLVKELGLYLIQNSSQKTSFQNLMKQLGFKSINTVRKYAEYLKDVFLVSELRGYSYKLTERSTSQPKIYACDVGLMNALWVKPTQDLGAKLETLVFNYLTAKKEEIYYFSNSKYEVDFGIIHNRKIKQFIQVCFSLRERKSFDREVRALCYMAKQYSCHNLLIITSDEKFEIKQDDLVIQVLPIHEWLSSDK